MKKHTVLSFVTLTGTIKYYDGTDNPTTDIKKAVKFKNSREAEKVNATLDAWYYRTTINEIAEGLYVL